MCLKINIPELKKKIQVSKCKEIYDSSGKLQIQIEQGLKSDVFFLQATKQMDALVE